MQTKNTLNTSAELFPLLRAGKPLIHHLTNYVTVTDCANICLAIGASPIMADAIEEAADIAAISQALVINIGTLNSRTLESMLAAGKSAVEKGIPVVFDPVGAGASRLRNEAAARILSEVKISVLRGNISEIRFLSGLEASTKGVDAADTDKTDDAAAIATTLAKKLGCVVAITGAVDYVADGRKLVRIHNGHAALGNITGTGCMCSTLVGSFCGAAPEQLFAATVAGIACMGIAGEIAWEKMGQYGNGSFHSGILDAISLMDAELFLGRAKLCES